MNMHFNPGAGEGATATELTSWQAHSVHRFLSGTAKKKLGLTVERITEDGRTAKGSVGAGWGLIAQVG